MKFKSNMGGWMGKSLYFQPTLKFKNLQGFYTLYRKDSHILLIFFLVPFLVFPTRTV